jgi:hypothetical protein
MTNKLFEFTKMYVEMDRLGSLDVSNNNSGFFCT